MTEGEMMTAIIRATKGTVIVIEDFSFTMSDQDIVRCLLLSSGAANDR